MEIVPSIRVFNNTFKGFIMNKILLFLVIILITGYGYQDYLKSRSISNDLSVIEAKQLELDQRISSIEISHKLLNEKIDSLFKQSQNK